MEQKERNSPLAGSKRKGDEDREKMRRGERWRARACAERP